MWDGLFTLLSFSLVMGLASFLAGSLPLSFGLSQNHSRAISAIGTGLLVGTCLIIIIPEGVETIYSAKTYAAKSPMQQPIVDKGAEVLGDPATIFKRQTAATTMEAEPHAWVGLSLIVGFVMMYLIDQLPRHASSFTSSKKPLHISLANLSQGPHRMMSPRLSEDAENVEDYHETQAGPKGSATTIGLVIHAAADGIALAASSFLSQSSTGFIVFLALMIHKAPAAFGLTSVLLKQGRTKRQARAHLIVFSLAAPIGALTTWILVNIIGGEHVRGQQGTAFATGLLLLFSGGTFLYVAMHTMQESGVDNSDEGGNGYGSGHTYASIRSGKSRDKHPDLRDTLLVVVGMLLPLLAQLGHAH